MIDVGIVVPTLGTRLNWLRTSLASITSQAVDKEVVVVTPDASAVTAIADNYGVRVLESARPGISAAVNDGWGALSSARFIAWLGDDDVLAPNSLRTCIQILDGDARATAVYGDVRYINGDDRTLFLSRPGKLAARYLPWGKDLVPQPGSLFRRTAVEEVGGLDETLRYAMDFDLFLKLGRVGELRYVPSELAAFRLHDSSVTGSNRSGDEAEFVRSQRHSERVNRVRRVMSPVFFGLNRLLYKAMQHQSTPHSETGVYFSSQVGKDRQ